MSTSADLPLQLADLPAPVAEAVKRMARRLSAWIQDNDYMISNAKAEEIITEELRPVLLGGPLPPLDPAPVIGVTTAKTDEAIRQWIANLPATGEWVKIEAFRGCIDAKPCHRCKVVWHSHICVCGLTHCYRCGHRLGGHGDSSTYERINSDHYYGPKAQQIDPLVVRRYTLDDHGRVVASP